MSAAIVFTVYGKSETKGSTRSFISNRTRPGEAPRIVTKNDNPNAKGWALRIGIEAALAMRGRPLLEGPVDLMIAFYLPRPKKLKRAEPHHTKKPDLDKLLRCAKDAMTNVVWRDDAQVTSVHGRKLYAGWALDPLEALGRPRAEIVVSPSAVSA